MRKNHDIPHPGWNFDNSYARLPEIFYSEQKPGPVASPQLVIFNHSLTASLGLDREMLAGEKGVAIFAGNQIPTAAFPIAQAYAGHQFGHFTMLGDGRAILLGEQITPQGERFDIQLKGSGRTPYSRGGDGRAALGPMLREYIISEAMYALGIPTTRSLAVVTTGENVLRESALPSAILARVAKSHLRVGTFQFAAQWGSVAELRTLADYAINRHYPEVENVGNKYLAFFKEVIKRQAELIAKWQLVGFIHGVMNTDNMTISGETIDYGPCAFMDTYNPETVFSSIDRQGRYAYGNQPAIAQWNLARFAETLLPLLDNEKEQSVKIAQTALIDFSDIFAEKWLAGMKSKLGIFNEEKEDEALIAELLDLMEKNKADYTDTFRSLTLGRIEGMTLFENQKFVEWQKSWKARLNRQEETEQLSMQLMRDNNPAIIPRNHRVEEALEASVKHGDYTVLKRLNAVLAKPYAYLPEQEEYAILPEKTSCGYRTFCGT